LDWQEWLAAGIATVLAGAIEEAIRRSFKGKPVRLLVRSPAQRPGPRFEMRLGAGWTAWEGQMAWRLRGIRHEHVSEHGNG
jgi:hypothetical protein